MIKLNTKQQILLQTFFIAFFLVLTVPLGHNQTFINLAFPNANSRSFPIGWLHFSVLVFAVYAFVKLRKSLIQLKSKWRFVLYLVIVIWLMTNVRTIIGEQLMSHRKGLNSVDFQFEKSEINYQKDTLGMVHLDGDLKFHNYGSDTLAFRGIIHGKDFHLMYNDSIADIHFPNNEFSIEQIKIPPKTTYTYHLKQHKNLEINTLSYSNYKGTINIISKITIYSGSQKRIFNY